MGHDRWKIPPRPYAVKLRSMKAITNRIWVDTDFGTMTLVFSLAQTVSGLQIRTPTGEWKHVKYIPDGYRSMLALHTL